MTPVTAAQRRQRQTAAVTHGLYAVKSRHPSGGKSRRSKDDEFGRLVQVKYDRLLNRCARSSGPTTAAVRLALRQIAYHQTLIDLGVAWLAEQPDQMFEDRRTGKIHPIIDRLNEWQSAVSRYSAVLPAERRRPTFASLRRR